MLINNGKIAFNIVDAVFLLKTDSGIVVNFVAGKSCIISQDDLNFIMQTENPATKNPLFIQFSENVYINPEKISFIKNNFENANASKWKVTVCLPSNHKEEFFVSFPIDKKQEAENLFNSLAECFA